MTRVLFLANHVAPNRVGAFAALGERVDLDLAVYGGRHTHGAPPARLGRRIDEAAVGRTVREGDHAAVICGLAGRRAPLAAHAAARRRGIPFVLWTGLWAHPRTLAHALTWLPTRALYRRADALVTYGPHVNAYLRRRAHVAPQSVDNAFWGAQSASEAPEYTVAFVGRDEPGKGLRTLQDAWDGNGALEVVTGGRSPEELRNLYARAHVLVVPSIRTRDFREPWGLVANEAMNQGTAIIASDEVGAVAGGLVRHERNGLVFAAGDTGALARAIDRLRGDTALREQLAANGRRDVAAFTHEAWASGFEAALREVGHC